MRAFILAIILGVVLHGPLTSPAGLLPQTLKIAVNNNEFGSGTVVGYRDGRPLVLTCAHVVSTSDGKIQIDGHSAHILLVDPSVDLAVVMLDDHVSYPVATIASLQPASGDDEVVVGYPLARREAIVRGYFGQREDDVVTQGSAPLYPGNSGGGAYSWHFFGGWELAGVADAVGIDTFSFQFSAVPFLAVNVSYTVSTDVVRAFLHRLDTL